MRVCLGGGGEKRGGVIQQMQSAHRITFCGINFTEDVVERPWDNAPKFWHLPVTFHRESFPGASLSIGKYGA